MFVSDMQQPIKTQSVPTGLTSFSSTNKSILKQNLESILTDSFKATFLFDMGEDGQDIANAFGKTAAGPLSDVIDDYVQNYIKSQLILLIPKGTLLSPVGPVTGNASTLTSDIIIS